jgi:hypothetical protein
MDRACQLQPGDPPLGALMKGGDIGRSQFEPHHPLQKIRGLCLRKSQVCLPDFHYLPARS